MNQHKIAKNMLSGTVYKILSIIIKFILRFFLIKELGTDLVGLNAVIADWMSMLNIATLGIEIAIQFRLYKPIAAKDYDKVSFILRAAQIVYRKIGIIIFVSGIVLMVFIPFLIKDSVFSTSYIYGAYLLSLLGVSASYLFCYKRILILAFEDVYVTNIIDICCEIIFITLEIIAISAFHNFYYFMGIGSLKLIVQHMLGSHICNKKYGIKTQARRFQQEEKIIVADMKDVAPLKIATYIYGYTDNILISKFVGLSSVALYSNYILIVNALLGVSTMLTNAVKATFGLRLNSSEEKEPVSDRLDDYIFFQYIFSIISTLSFYILIDFFISKWLGHQYIIHHIVLILIVTELFLRLIYQPLQMVFEATGSFKKEKEITFVSSLINITISIILVNLLGLAGPIIGTITTDIIILIYRVKCIENDYFKQPKIKSIVKWTSYICIFVILFFITIFVRTFLAKNFIDILQLILGELFVLLITFVIVILFYFKSRPCQRSIQIIFNYLKFFKKENL